MYTKNTKIVCTLGPASDSLKEITGLIHAGMNVARLNFSHGTYEEHKRLIRNVHRAEKLTGKRIGIMQDLQGPKIRLGELPDKGINLKTNEKVILTIKNIEGIKTDKKILIPVRYKNILKDVKKNDIVLIKDGLIELRALEVQKTQIICRVKFGGIINSRNGVNLPTSTVSTTTITAKDKKDLAFGLKHNVDFVALSFVKNKKDIEDLRKMIKKANKRARIIAKIERHEAVTNLKEIIKATDAVMVARGDLGTDVPAERVPIIQKRMIALANKFGKPIITATQVLQSMVTSSRATRAEISDAANAIFDRTDAIMLSNESAVGKYPVRATTTLTKVASAIEKEIQNDEIVMEHLVDHRDTATLNATCHNACELAIDTKANYIVVYTNHGYTARNIAKHRHFIPIITITPHEKTARQLTLVWGINKVFVKRFPETAAKSTEIFQFLKKNKVIKKGEKVVIVCNASKKESTISTCKI